MEAEVSWSVPSSLTLREELDKKLENTGLRKYLEITGSTRITEEIA